MNPIPCISSDEGRSRVTSFHVSQQTLKSQKCLGGKDFHSSSCSLRRGDRIWFGLQNSDKLCHMPDLVVKCSIFLQAELKDEEGGFHAGCEETGMRGQKVGWRRKTHFRNCGELLLQPEAQHTRALQALPTALPRMVFQCAPPQDKAQRSQPSALISPAEPRRRVLHPEHPAPSRTSTTGDNERLPRITYPE